MDLVIYKNDHAVTNSKVIAEAFGKPHRTVIRSVESLECSDEFRAHNFVLSYYTSPQNKKLKCYEITRDGFSFLCMGFTGSKAAEWKEKYINAFNQMERGLLNIDARMSKLSIDGENLKRLGSEWSDFGRSINEAKKKHKQEVQNLISDVQLNLEV